MNISEMHTAFKLEIDKSEGLELPAFEQEEIDKWLNNAIRKFVKTRYTEFEQSQKRMDDLSALVREEMFVVVPYTKKPNTVYVTLPKKVNDVTNENADGDGIPLVFDYWFTISEAVDILYDKLGETYTSTASGDVAAGFYFIKNLVVATASILAIPDSELTISDATGDVPIPGFIPSLTYNGVTYYEGMCFKGLAGTGAYGLVEAGSATLYVQPHMKRVSITEVTADNFEAKYRDPYSEHVLHYEEAKPLRILGDDIVELTTDGNYGIMYYHLRYIKRPETVNIETETNVSSGDIVEGLKYIVATGTTHVTYNGVEYEVTPSDTDYFYGVYGVDTFAQSVATTDETVNLVQQDCELSEHTHDEIVKLAASMALENIEQPRYQSHMNEVATME